MINYTLKQIAEITGGQLIGDGNVVVRGVQYDSRLMQKGQMFAPFVGERMDGHSFVKDLFEKGIEASLWSKGSLVEKPQGNLVVVDDVLVALQTIAEHYRDSLNVTFVGVTGSSGKTSTKDIVAAVLSAKYKTYKTKGNFNNKLGVPLTLINMDDDVEVAVIEMGIDDFGIMEMLVKMVKPDYTIITSIGPAHVQQFKTIDNIVQQKCWINSRLKSTGKCFYNHQAYGLTNQLKEMGLESQSVGYGFDEESDVMAISYDINESGTTFVTREYPERTFVLPILGKHQVLNGLAGIAIGTELGLTIEQVQQGFNSIVLTPHRLQLLNINEAIIIDDTYNSNPSSLTASLSTMIEYNDSYEKTVVIGDMLELGENSLAMHAGIAEAIDFSKFNNIYVVGNEMKALKQALDNKGISAQHYDSYSDVAAHLKKHLTKGNAVFFKASNGMRFARLIELLKEEF